MRPMGSLPPGQHTIVGLPRVAGRRGSAQQEVAAAAEASDPAQAEDQGEPGPLADRQVSGAAGSLGKRWC